MWACAARGFLAAAQLGDVLIFAPELLSGTHYYARLFANHEGVLVEETDRYAQALLYQRWIRNIFSSVQADNHSLQNF